MRKLIAILALLFVAGCGGHDISSGVVQSKKYEKPYDYIYMMPLYTGETCYGTGSSRYCTANYMYIPTNEHVGPKWKVKIQDADGKHATWTISKAEYNKIRVGQEWSADADRG